MCGDVALIAGSRTVVGVRGFGEEPAGLGAREGLVGGGEDEEDALGRHVG